MVFSVLRREGPDQKPYWQSFRYEPAGENETAATALTSLNEQPELRDAEGKAARPIQWERNCLQKKCGACAMVVNGVPRLACDTFLRDCGATVRLEPLRKFPVVADLVVDRGVMWENLRTLRLWLIGDAQAGDRASELAYEASRCLQCGCCLEVCPNFAPGGAFTGMAGAVPASRLLAELPEAQRREAARLYREHVYEGCGKSLACRDICPAGLDIDTLLVNSNAAAVWKRFLRR